MHNVIDKKILDEEECIRCVMHPFHVRKRKLKREAFLPPIGKHDVSVLRHRYCTLDYCKQHAKSMNNEKKSYLGLACFRKNDITELNQEYENVNADLVYSPIDCNNNYIDLNLEVTQDTPGLPMHADFQYNHVLVKESEVYTELREYAQKFSKKVQFRVDDHPESGNWDMGEFTV